MKEGSELYYRRIGSPTVTHKGLTASCVLWKTEGGGDKEEEDKGGDGGCLVCCWYDGDSSYSGSYDGGFSDSYDSDMDCSGNYDSNNGDDCSGSYDGDDNGDRAAVIVIIVM